MERGSETSLSKEEIFAKLLERVFRETHKPDDVDAYHRRKQHQVTTGKPTWWVRNFDSDQGRIYDFFENAETLGFVEEDYSYGCVAYLYRDGGHEPLNTEPMILGDAVFLVEARAGNIGN